MRQDGEDEKLRADRVLTMVLGPLTPPVMMSEC